MSVSNPFTGAKAWAGDTMLQVGRHVAKIVQCDDATAKVDPYRPMLELRFENDDGYQRDRVPYDGELVGKLASLFDAAGIERPQDGEFDPNDKFRLTASCRQRLVGKEVGLTVKEEPDREDPQKMWPRVKGYYNPQKAGQDLPADTDGLPDIAESESASRPAGEDKRIPF
jgi:hypothetical protein